MAPILTFEHVSKTYSNGTQALKDVSFQAEQGEFISIIGPSGSGKSTLLRSINQLIGISEGKVYVGLETVNGKKGKALRQLRRRVGMIFQNYNLVYRLSVLQNVLHGRLGYMSCLDGVLGRFREADKKEALALLEEIGLAEFARTRASDLSGGQKQRVGIARALMQSPDLLLCDEPIASLDPVSSQKIMNMLFETTQKRNITCIVNLHQVDIAKQYSTRIIGLEKGRIVFDGKPDELSDTKLAEIYGSALHELERKEDSDV